MVWDTEQTRRKLLIAAIEQFAAAGLAGARVDAIARAAGVNKERIYQYFGDKAGLFGAVLQAEVEGLLAGIEVVGEGPDALGNLAEQLYDRTAERPHVVRLLAWESLELAEPVSPDARAAGCAKLVSALAIALRKHNETDAAQTLLSLIALTITNWSLPHLGGLVTPRSTQQTRRAAVVSQARLLL